MMYRLNGIPKLHLMKYSLTSPALALLALMALPFGAVAEGVEQSMIVADSGQTGTVMPVQGAEVPVKDHMTHMVADLPNGLVIEHPFLLVAGPAAKSAAAFMVIKNSGAADDRLIAADVDFANTVQLHTHIMENGIAKMREVEGGFEVEAGGRHELARGGDHIMLMGLKSVPAFGDTVNFTLTFENAGTVIVPVVVMQAGPAGAMPHTHK